MPGTLRSSVYFPAPVVFPAASTMAMRLPIIENPLFIVVGRRLAGYPAPVTLCRSPTPPEIKQPKGCPLKRSEGSRVLLRSRHRFLLGFDSRLNRLVHLAIAGTPAQVAAQCNSDLLLGGLRIYREQIFDRHHESGRAISALRAAPISVSFLDGC